MYVAKYQGKLNESDVIFVLFFSIKYLQEKTVVY